MAQRSRTPRPRRKGKVKTGNIFLLLLIIGMLVYYFNRTTIDQKLVDSGIKEGTKTEQTNGGDSSDKSSEDTKAQNGQKAPNSEEDTTKKGTQENGDKGVDAGANKANANSSNEGTDASKTDSTKTTGEPSTKGGDNKLGAKANTGTDAKNKGKNGKPSWRIITETDNTLFLNEDNVIQISALGINTEEITPMVKERHVKIKTTDKKKGLYTIKSNKKGKATVMLMTKINKKVDVLGTQEFEVKDRSDIPSGYTWVISSEMEDTLIAGKKNKLEIAVAEVNPRHVKVEISEGGKIKAVNIHEGQYVAQVPKAGTASINIKLKKNGNLTQVGKKEFIVISPQAAEKMAELKGEPNEKAKQDSAKTDNKEMNAHQNDTTQKAPTPNIIVDASAFSNDATKSQYLAAIASKSNGIIPVTDLKSAKSLDLIDRAGQSAANVGRIVRFEMMHYPMGQAPESAVNGGNNFAPNAQSLLEKAQTNDLYYFGNIKVRTTNGKVVNIPDLSLKVQ